MWQLPGQGPRRPAVLRLSFLTQTRGVLLLLPLNDVPHLFLKQAVQLSLQKISLPPSRHCWVPSMLAGKPTLRVHPHDLEFHLHGLLLLLA